LERPPLRQRDMGYSRPVRYQPRCPVMRDTRSTLAGTFPRLGRGCLYLHSLGGTITTRTTLGRVGC
jgi:hypothetical protein